MRPVTVIRHVHFEDLGVFEDVLAVQGFAIRYLDAGIDDLRTLPNLGGDLLVVLGGPIGAYQDDQYPFLADELRIIEGRLARGLPALGICLGAQLMARALGASVYPASKKEVGWAPIALTDAGLHSSIRHLTASNTPVFHWHGDTFDLPHGATLLASTNVCINQAFSWSGIGMALQFHPEVKAANIERWLIGHACELSGPSMPDIHSLRSETLKYGSTLQRYAKMSFGQWLSDVGLVSSVAGAQPNPG